jgi:GNAT superfamily N-acetyltransferase
MTAKPGSLAVRDLEAGDLEALLQLYRQLQHEDEPAPLERAKALWETIRADPAQIYMGGFVADELVSACCAVIVPNLTRGGRPYAVIENVVTDAHWRRKGVGREVLGTLVARCWQRGCYKVTLTSGLARGGAHEFYENVGFDRNAKQAFVIRRP